MIIWWKDDRPSKYKYSNVDLHQHSAWWSFVIQIDLDIVQKKNTKKKKIMQM
jgi:hypothetical protein